MHRALREAYRTMPSEKLNFESEAVKKLRENLNLPEIDHEKWIKLPRRFSRFACRFELPMDSREFKQMTSIDYLAHYVSVGRSQKQLYRRVFLRNLPEEVDETNQNLNTVAAGFLYKSKLYDNNDDDDNSSCDGERNQNSKCISEINERILPYNSVDIAMQEALGFHGTIEKIEEIKNILNLNTTLSHNRRENNSDGLNFRTWCGVLAFAERYLNKLDRSYDPPNEIEIADFESLERRLNSIKIEDENLIHVLKLIKYK